MFSFVNSIGTGLVTNGIYFLTQSRQGYRFSAVENLWLAVAIGVTYIGGAKLAGPVQRALRRAFPRLSSRGFLALLMLFMGILCVIPPILRAAGVPERSPLGLIGLGVLALGYSPASGMLWPTVESYVSGGRRGHTLRRAIGLWNVVWSAAIPLAYFGMSGIIEHEPVVAFVALGAVHLAAIALLRWFHAEPAPHPPDGHEPHPVVYVQLLAVLRFMLPLAYVMTSALGPMLPDVLLRLGVSEQWRPIIGTAWLVPRVVTFWVLQAWHGWHGRWTTPLVGGALLIGGFAGTMLAPWSPRADTAVAVIVGCLIMFGTGMATLYKAAIYYAMEVGHSGVDAGGTHEALIGVGYTVGPLCALGGFGLVRLEVVPNEFRDVSSLVIIGVLVAGTLLAAANSAWRAKRSPGRT